MLLITAVLKLEWNSAVNCPALEPVKICVIPKPTVSKFMVNTFEFLNIIDVIYGCCPAFPVILKTIVLVAAGVIFIIMNPALYGGILKATHIFPVGSIAIALAIVPAANVKKVVTTALGVIFLIFSAPLSKT